jgi:hypothetical protein
MLGQAKFVRDATLAYDTPWCGSDLFAYGEKRSIVGYTIYIILSINYLNILINVNGG